MNYLYQMFFACVFTILLWNTEWLEDFFNSDFSYSLRGRGLLGTGATVMAGDIFQKEPWRAEGVRERFKVR